MTMDSNVVKFPYSSSRRVHSKKPRRSKNGTPEERAAKAAAMPAPANVVTLSRDQPTPPIVNQVERIVAKYDRLDLDGQALISKLIDGMIAQQSRK